MSEPEKLFYIQWRVEGSTVIGARDSEQAISRVEEMLTQWDLPNHASHQTAYDDPEILGCLNIDALEVSDDHLSARANR